MREYLVLFIILATVFAILILILIACALYWILKNPYTYPYMITRIDVSYKRNVKLMDELDRYLCAHSFIIFQNHYKRVQNWKEETEDEISKLFLKSWRKKQYFKILDDEHMFIFVLTRGQTRYVQRNYVKMPYKMSIESDRAAYSLKQVAERYKLLSEINFQCTLNEYSAKDQRKLMTKALREQIKRRDNYTCQLCGKYMPDEVGLHIDHIIPISKGGKSVPSNLQVLCSKCNGKKSNRL